MLVWALISTMTLVTLQFFAYSFLPTTLFIDYSDTATVKDVKLGDAPVVSYCRNASDSYGVVFSGQLIRLDPPVYTKQYFIYVPVEPGHHCLNRESVIKPDLPGKYQMYYTAEITLPFGIKKYESFYTNTFTVTESEPAPGSTIEP